MGGSNANLGGLPGENPIACRNMGATRHEEGLYWDRKFEDIKLHLRATKNKIKQNELKEQFLREKSFD